MIKPWSRYLFVFLSGTLIANTTLGQEGDVKDQVICIEQCGAVPNDGEENGDAIRQAIAKAIASDRPATIQFGDGCYRVSANRGRTCFPIRGARNLVLKGQGNKTEIIVTDPRAGVFGATVCDGITFKDFLIDYDPLPFTQGRIVSVDQVNSTFDLDIDPGFPLLSQPWFAEASDEHGKWGMIFDSRDVRLKTGAGDHVRLATWTHVKETYEANAIALPPARYNLPLCKSRSPCTLTPAPCPPSVFPDVLFCRAVCHDILDFSTRVVDSIHSQAR